MAFIQEAQQFLVSRIVPHLKDFLTRETYVHRLLFHVQADVQTALVHHRLRKTYAVADEDLQALEDCELARQPRLCLIGMQVLGKVLSSPLVILKLYGTSCIVLQPLCRSLSTWGKISRRI